MVHQMNLRHSPFLKIKNKTKTIELRLNDEKRSHIKIGDIIEFTDNSNDDKMSCLVTNLYRYSDFDELYQKHDKTLIGYDKNDCADPADMLKYYSAERIKQYGVLGIEITVLSR